LVGFALIGAIWLVGIVLTLVGPARRWLRCHPARRRATRLIRDVAGVGLCFAVYGSLQWAVPLANPRLFDLHLAHLDRLLFGGHDPALLFDPLVSPTLTLVFSALYFLHFPLFFLTPLVLFWQQRERERADVTLALMLAMYLGYVGYFLVPAYGPLYGLADSFANPLPDNPLRDVVRGYGAALGTFPSLHAGIAAVVVSFARRHHRRLFPLLLAVALGIWASTLYLRYHYVIDLLAGWALAAACVWLAPRLNRARDQWLLSRRARQTRVRIARRAWTSVACSVRVLLG
jgi:membrane-associated phospholipid phosphatase